MRGRIKGNAITMALRIRDLDTELEITDICEILKVEDELRGLEVVIGGVLQDVDRYRERCKEKEERKWKKEKY